MVIPRSCSFISSAILVTLVHDHVPNLLQHAIIVVGPEFLEAQVIFTFSSSFLT